MTGLVLHCDVRGPKLPVGKPQSLGGGLRRGGMEGGLSGMWSEGELGGQKEMQKGRAGVVTPFMVDMV